jgi:hypothetical protein
VRAGRVAYMRRSAPGGADCLGAPSMGAILEVQVLPRADHGERSEVQLREGDRAWEGSMKRNPRGDGQEPHMRRCAAGRACQETRSSRGQGGHGVDAAQCAGKDRVLTWGDLALRLKGRRAVGSEREVSRGRSSPREWTKGRTRRRVTTHAARRRCNSVAGTRVRGRGVR